VLYGVKFQESVSGQSITSGTTVIETVPTISGCSANFNYCVRDTNGYARAGTVKAIWDSSTAGYADYSTTDINGPTTGISFTVDVNGGNVRLKSVVTSGTWTIKVSTEITF
jgi:hypothetical protein